MSNKVDHASYHHELCSCGDPWCHGCPTDEEFHAERDAAGRISLPWSADEQAIEPVDIEKRARFWEEQDAAWELEQMHRDPRREEF